MERRRDLSILNPYEQGETPSFLLIREGQKRRTGVGGGKGPRKSKERKSRRFDGGWGSSETEE